MLYTTGHGVHVGGVTYLLPGHYPVFEGNSGLTNRALRVSDLRQPYMGSSLTWCSTLAVETIHLAAVDTPDTRRSGFLGGYIHAGAHRTGRGVF